jgi:hypothetical protein
MIEEDLPELTPPFPEPPQSPFWIAALIDNVVYQMQNVEAQQAALYLSQPTFVRFSPGETAMGWKYDPETKKFTRPSYDPETDTFSY